MLTALLLFPILSCPQGQPATRPAETRPASRPTETLVVLNKSDATVSLIDPTTGTTRHTVEVGTGPHEAAVSTDGRTLVVCNYGDQLPGNTLSVIDLTAATPKGRRIELDPYRRPHGIQFLADGKTVAVTAEMDKKLLLVDLAAGKVSAEIDTGQQTSHMVALAPDGRHAYVANIGSGSVSILDLAEQKLVAKVPTGKGAEGIAVHPTRPEVWLANRAADTVSVVDTDKNTVLATIACAKFPIRIAFTPDGKHALVSCAQSGDVAVCDVAERTVVKRVAMDGEIVDKDGTRGRMFAAEFQGSPVPVGVLIPPGSKVAYVANTNADIVTLVELGTWRIAGRIKTGGQPDGMAWSRL